MTDVKLESLTKADLIWVITRMRNEPLGESRFQRAMVDLESRREMERINEADRQLGISIEARKQAVDILRPYDGQRIVDIPFEVMEQVDKCSKQAERAYKAYLRLSNVK